MDDDLRKTLGEAIDAQVKGLAERQAISTAKYLNESYAAVRKEMNHHLINRLNTIANGFQYAIQYGSQYTAQWNYGAVCREAVAEIERLEKMMEQNNSKHMEVLGKLKERNEEIERLKEEIERYGNKLLDSATKHSEAIQRNDEMHKISMARRDQCDKLIEENNRLDGKNLWLESEVKRLKEQVEELEKSFPGYETVHIKPEELFGNSGLTERDHIAIAVLEGTLSAKGWHPEYIIPSGGGHVGGQRAADAAAESAYKYADAMLKAREK